MEATRKTNLALTTLSVLLIYCVFGLLLLVADLTTDMHVATIRATMSTMRLCEETRKCFGGYLVFTDGRIFRIDDGKPIAEERQAVSQDDMLSYKENSAFLKNVKEIVLQSDRGQWLLYTKKRAEQISKERPPFRD